MQRNSNNNSEKHNGSLADKAHANALINYLSAYYLPVVCLFGIVGNTCIVLVFVGHSRRKLNLSRVVRLLYVLIAVHDSGVLLSYHFGYQFLQHGLHWLTAGRFSLVLTATDWGCKCQFFISYYFEGASNILVAYLATERYVNVFHPMKLRIRQAYFNLHICTLLLLCMLLSCSCLFSYSNSYSYSSMQQKIACMPSTQGVSGMLNLAATLINLPLPAAIIILSNGLCLLKLRARLRLRGRRSKAQVQSLQVLFWLSGTCLALVLPCAIADLLCKTVQNSRVSKTARDVMKATYIASSAVHASNALIYLCHMRRFRQTLLLPCTAHKNNSLAHAVTLNNSPQLLHYNERHLVSDF